MPWLLFSYISAAFLMSTILGVILVVFILDIKKKAPHTWLLIGYFSAYTLMNFCGMMLLSHPTTTLIYASGMVILFFLLAPLLLQFAYYFPANIHPRESKVMLVGSCAVFILGSWVLIDLSNFDSSGWLIGFDELKWTIVLLLVAQMSLYFWIFLVWTRKILWLERQSNQPFWRKLLLPQSRHGKAMLYFMLLFSLSLFFPTLDVMQIKGFITQEQQFLIFVFIGLIIFAFFFLIYIHQFPEQSPLMAKLLGACLLLVLPVLIHEGYRLDQVNQQLWHEARLHETRLYEKHLKDNYPWERPPKLRYILSYPEQPVPHENDYIMHYAAPDAPDIAHFTRFDRTFRERNLIRGLNEKTRAIVENKPLYAFRERAADFHAMVLVERYIHYDFLFKGRRYEMGYSYLEYRGMLSPSNLHLGQTLVTVMLVVFLFFPILFKHMLIRPLDALTRSVREAQSGNMHVKAPIFGRDEIGFLAQSFNTMINTFRAAQTRIEKEVAKSARLEAENARKDEELQQAHQLQMAMLPQTVPTWPDLEIAVFMKPATEVGGDYYDFQRSQSGELIVCVGDATGHGLQAGTMVAATKSLFNAMVDHQKPVSFLIEASKALASMGYKNMYMALMVARIHQGRVNLTSAGMPYALVYRSQSKTLEEMRLPGLPLGSRIAFPYSAREFFLNPDDVLLLKSDGLEERFNEDDQLLGDKRVSSIFAENAHHSAEQIIQILVGAGNSWGKSRPQDDDITLVVLKRKSEGVMG